MEQIVFMCKTANLNIIKKKGATVVTAVPGGTRSEVTPTSWIKFRDHKYIATDPEEIGIIRDHIKTCPKDGIAELVPRTPEDVVKEKEMKLAQVEKELMEAQKAAGIEEKIEEALPDYKCPHCGLIRHKVRKMKLHCQSSHARAYSLDRIGREFLVKR